MHRPRYRYAWEKTTIGVAVFVLIGTPTLEQVREHQEEGAKIEHRFVRHDHAHDGDPPLKIASPQVTSGTATMPTNEVRWRWVAGSASAYDELDGTDVRLHLGD